METSPGIKTSEGITAIVAVLTPLGAALAKLEGWQLVAALCVAAFVASVYIGARTWLKGRGVAALLVLALLSAPRAALADPPVAEVRALPAAAADEPAPVATPAPAVPNLAALPDCITQGAANAATACITGKAPPPTDRRTFWITWGTSMGSTVATAALAWITNHYALNPEPVK